MVGFLVCVCAWHLSLDIFLRFIDVVACIHSSFIFIALLYSIDNYNITCLSIHLLMNIWVCFQFGAMINKAAVNIFFYY